MARVGLVLAVIVVLIVAAFAFYAGWTYPRATVNFSVSFTAGLDARTVAFEQPILDEKAQIQVAVESGVTLWQAQILNGSQVIWEHSAAQADQLSYTSDWINLPSGNYNFTFTNIGFNSLDATVTVTSKGGFW